MSDNKSKLRFNITRILILVVIVLLIAIGIGGYKYFYDYNNEPVITAVNNTPSSATPVPEDNLPEIATDINSYQYLLNKNSVPLDSSYVPEDLEDPENVNSTSSIITVRSEVAKQLESMITAANDSGITILVSSGYRSYDEQDQLYTAQVKLLSESNALTAVEKPGYSEHQLGLAVDLTDDAETPNETEAFADTDAGKWLSEHAHEYGFILRYPKGKESVTKYNYMPWHYRYVGVDTATEIYNTASDYTLEEYFENWSE